MNPAVFSSWLRVLRAHRASAMRRCDGWCGGWKVEAAALQSSGRLARQDRWRNAHGFGPDFGPTQTASPTGLGRRGRRRGPTSAPQPLHLSAASAHPFGRPSLPFLFSSRGAAAGAAAGPPPPSLFRSLTAQVSATLHPLQLLALIAAPPAQNARRNRHYTFVVLLSIVQFCQPCPALLASPLTSQPVSARPLVSCNLVDIRS